MNLLKQIGLRAVKKMSDYPKDWGEVRLDNIANIFDNLRVPVSKDKRTVGNTPYYGANGIQDYVSGYTHDGEFVLLAEDGANSLIDYPITYTKGKIWVNNHAHVLSGKNGITNTNFLAYLLKKVNYEEILVGGTRLKLNGKILRNINIYLPPLPEQKAIADTLTIFDKHIENLEKLIEKKKMIRDGALEDLMSGKRRLEGFNGEWEEVSFNDVITPKARIGWQGLKKDEYLESGYSYLISGTDFENGTISFDNINYVTKERFDLDINIQVTSGDVLVTKDGTIGKVAIVPIINKKATLNSGVFVFKTNDKLKSIFLFMILRSSIFKRFIDELSAGSTIKHLYQKDLKTFSFYIPIDIKEQEAIATILTSMDDEIEDLEKEKAKIENLKAGAMDDLLTGRVRLI